MTETRTMPVLPIEAYTSQEFFELEQREIFSKTWQFAGFIEDVQDPGDTFTVQVGLTNLIVVRGHDQRLRAMHNLCRHRGTQLLRTIGKNKKSFTCPYHDWTYSLEGELKGVPEHKEEFANLDKKKLCLHKASVTTWRGMIFVHPHPAPEPFSKWVEGVEPNLGPHRPEELVEYEGTASEILIQANWKIVAENFIDVYHLSHLHSATLNMYDHRKHESGFVGPHYTFYEPLATDYAANLRQRAPFPVIDHGTPEQLGAYAPLLFPNLGLAETESSWSIFHMIPIAPDQTRVVTRTKLMPASGWEFAKQAMRAAWFWPRGRGSKYGDPYSPDDPMSTGDFTAEDIYVCEQQQRSLRSPLFSVGATAETLEAAVRTFQSIVQDRVSSP